MYKKNQYDILIDIYTPCVVEKSDTSGEILEHIKICASQSCVCVYHKTLNKT